MQIGHWQTHSGGAGHFGGGGVGHCGQLGHSEHVGHVGQYSVPSILENMEVEKSLCFRIVYQGNINIPIINILYNPLKEGKGMEISFLVNCPLSFLGIF